MKRNIELVRLLLLKVEGEQPPDLDAFTDEQVRYHFALLSDAGLVRASSNGYLSGPKSLTWKGHDFLDLSRNPTVWQHFRNTVRAAAADLSIGLATRLLEKLAGEHLGI